MQEDTYRGTPGDPLSLNYYTYTMNNPLVYWDPTGFASAQVTFGGQTMTFDDIVQKDDYTYVGLRDFTDYAGISLYWNDPGKFAYMYAGKQVADYTYEHKIIFTTKGIDLDSRYYADFYPYDKGQGVYYDSYNWYIPFENENAFKLGYMMTQYYNEEGAPFIKTYVDLHDIIEYLYGCNDVTIEFLEQVTENANMPFPDEYSDIHIAQSYLNTIGFNIGIYAEGHEKEGQPMIDGFMGAKTSSAIIIFQYSQGIPITGVADTATITMLNKCSNNNISYSDIMESDIVKNWKPEIVQNLGQNGRLDTSTMTQLPTTGSGHGYARKKVAVAWALMVNDAMKYNSDSSFINSFALMGSVSGYRSFEDQQRLFDETKAGVIQAYNNKGSAPGVYNAMDKYNKTVYYMNAGNTYAEAINYATRFYAAKPGTSNHGYGIALDMQLGGYGTDAHNWISNHGEDYGFYKLPNEYWHFDYKPK